MGGNLEKDIYLRFSRDYRDIWVNNTLYTLEKQALTAIIAPERIPELFNPASGGSIRPYILVVRGAAFNTGLTIATSGYTPGDVSFLRQMGLGTMGAINQARFRADNATHPMVRLMDLLGTL